MASFNKVVLVGRLTNDVETRSFGNGGMVSKFRFAVNSRKKNSQTGNWEDEPMFIDCEAFNRGEFGKLADRIRDYCKKGQQILIEGKLHLEQWDDKTTGAKRSKHKVVVDNFEFMDTKQDGAGGPRGGGSYSPPTPRQNSNDDVPQDDGGGYDQQPPPAAGKEEDIPF